MKKYLFVGLIIFFTSNLVAQNKKIIGNWKENYHTIVDTSSNGIEEINSNHEAYRKGYKKLDSNYINYQEVQIENDSERWEISITKEKDSFWVINGTDLKAKLIYAPKTNNYYINPKDWWGIHGALTVEYDDKNQKVLFIDEELKLTMFEFSRK